jgi:hypothetical protein
MTRTLALVFLLASCADPYGDAKAADTIESWEKFIAGGATGSDKMKAESRLEQLMVKHAEETKAVADYDAVLKRFPSTRHKKDMASGRANAAFALAEVADTTEGWKTFLAENPTADGALKKRAKAMVDVAEYRQVLAIGEATVAEANLANDPAGPKDGWSISAPITNNGTVALEYASIELVFRSGAGEKLKAINYPIAAPTGPGGMPIEEALTKPLAPGETRTWSYATGETPEGWLDGRKVSLTLIAARPAPAAP